MKNVVLEAVCTDMTVEGYGVCKVDGLVIFTKGMIIGERALIKIIAKKKNLAYAIIDKLLEASPHRVTPDCPVAYKCGGCDLRHISYDYQLELKRKWLRDTLHNIADINCEIPEIVASPLTESYRNKVQVPVKDHKLGFYRTNSHDIVECDDCKIQTSKANVIINFIRDYIINHKQDNFFRHVVIKEGFSTGEVMVALILKCSDYNGLDTLVSELVKNFPDIRSVIVNVNTRDDNVILGEEEIVKYGSSYIIDDLDGLELKISLKSFYQINHGQMLQIYKEIVSVANVNKDTRVLDLYSGIGSIALFLARYAKEVTGVEIVASAIEDAKDNALTNGITNAQFILADATKGMDEYIEDKDVIIVDPPRKGLNQELITSLSKSDADIVYVSCNPATLARDLKQFMTNGYTIKYLRGFDMFPHTTHIETVVLMSKVKE